MGHVRVKDYEFKIVDLRKWQGIWVKKFSHTGTGRASLDRLQIPFLEKCDVTHFEQSCLIFSRCLVFGLFLSPLPFFRSSSSFSFAKKGQEKKRQRDRERGRKHTSSILMPSVDDNISDTSQDSKIKETSNVAAQIELTSIAGDNHQEQQQQYRVYPVRFYGLTLIALLNIGSSLSWLCVAPIPEYAQTFFNGTSLTAINWFSNVFMLVFIFIGPLSSFVYDRHSIKMGVSLELRPFILSRGRLMQVVVGFRIAGGRCHAAISRIMASFFLVVCTAASKPFSAGAHRSGIWMYRAIVVIFSQ